MRYALAFILMIGTAQAAQTVNITPPITEWVPKCADAVESIMASGKEEAAIQADIRRYMANVDPAYEMACTREIFRRIKERHR